MEALAGTHPSLSVRYTDTLITAREAFSVFEIFLRKKKGIYPEGSSHAVNHVASAKTDFPS